MSFLVNTAHTNQVIMYLKSMHSFLSTLYRYYTVAKPSLSTATWLAAALTLKLGSPKDIIEIGTSKLL